MKKYSSKSNAKRAATSYFVTALAVSKEDVQNQIDEYCFVEKAGDGFVYTLTSIGKTLIDSVTYDGETYCPECDVHLSSNGVDQGRQKQWRCKECGYEFGDNGLSVDAEAPAIKIQKDRAEQNGVVRPSEGGACAKVWHFCDTYVNSSGKPPALTDVKIEASENGWNTNNAVIEYYNWRKFKGIRGRLKK